MEQTIYFAGNSNLANVFHFCKSLDNINNSSPIIIDFSTMGRVDPFALLYTSNAIKNLCSANPDIQLNFKNYHSRTYPSNMGFFKSFGLNFGKNIGELSGGKNFLPICKINLEDISEISKNEWRDEQDILEEKAEQLAKILSRNTNDEILKTLIYSITEIMRNVFEHSESREIYYCAQHWPSYKKVDIAILDNGIGLKKSLLKNPHLDINNYSEAIQLSMMPGISSTNYKGSKRVDKSDKWRNTGFGLYMASRLGRNGGQIAICSGNHCVYQDHSIEKKHFPLNHYFQGTAVKLLIDTTKIIDLASLLRKFKLEGFEIAKHHAIHGDIDGNSASQYITTDFN